MGEQGPVSAAAGMAVPAQASAGRVLLVDDDEAGRYAKKRILQQAGYTVFEASTGAGALQCIREEGPELVLLDIRLPDINGLEVCRRIKVDPQTALLPVLQISASFCDDQSKVEGLQGGADGYIAEPVEPALLVATVAAFLRIKRAEQATRERTLEWQTTFDAINDGVALVDTRGNILRGNRALGEFFAVPTADLAGAVFDELIPPDGDAPVRQKLQMRGRQRVERRRRDRVFALTVDPVSDGDGGLRGGVCILSDITDRKLLDERLWRTQKLESIGVLAGGVAHDFNNLLMGILGNASLALESGGDAESSERALRDIIRAGERAADLTRQLLAYAGKGRFVVRPLNLSVLVSEMVPLVQASFPRKVTIVLNLAGNLPAIEADKTQVEQVVMNLLINAAEAIGENGGTLEVTARHRNFSHDARQDYIAEGEVRGRYISLEVRDDGAGMDDETLRRIFDPFFTTKFMGRGLGLSAVLGIMRSHKGAIRVSSQSGRGTTFELLFPTATAAVEGAASDGGQRLERAGRTRVLVVDDEEVVRNFFRSALERYGYEPLLVADGQEAMRIFSESPDAFPIVLLDMVMPAMSGKDIVPLLLEMRPDVKIVVTSGQVEEDVRRELGQWQIAGFIQKPCAIRHFIQRFQAFARTNTAAAD
jgi:two-component system cell cycle sensor histidine kinase/response regulator CckA